MHTAWVKLNPQLNKVTLKEVEIQTPLDLAASTLEKNYDSSS